MDTYPSATPAPIVNKSTKVKSTKDLPIKPTGKSYRLVGQAVVNGHVVPVYRYKHKTSKYES